jgi:WD40 repeat protein
MYVRYLLPLILPAFLSACAPSRSAAPESPVEASAQQPLAAKPSEEALILKHDDNVGYVCFFPDGKTLLSASRWSGGCRIRIWDTIEGTEKYSFHLPDKHSRVALSQDGRLIASGDNNTPICLWDAATGKELQRIPCKPGEGPWSLTFSPDSTRLFGGLRGSVRIWSVETGEALQTITTHGYIMGLALSQDGQWLAARSCTSPPRLIRVATGEEVFWFKEGGGAPLSISPDGRSVLTLSRSNSKLVLLWSAETGEVLRSVKAQDRMWHAAQFSPDGRWLATAGEAGNIALWDVQTGEEILQMKGHTGIIRSLAFSPDGKRLASGSDDTTLRLWNLDSIRK